MRQTEDPAGSRPTPPSDNEGLLPAEDPRFRSWDQLAETYREANRQQADEFPAYLARIGCGLLPVEHGSPGRVYLTSVEVEQLGRLEHERWCDQKRAAGHRWGPHRDDLEKVHPSLVPWDELSEQEREKDRQAVRNMPVRLAAAGFETYRLGGAGRDGRSAGWVSPVPVP